MQTLTNLILRQFFLLFIVSIQVGCATSQKVFTDYDQRHSFANYKTFSWLTPEPAIIAGEFSVSDGTITRFTNAIKNNLEAKGFTYTSNASAADFLLSYTLGAREKVSVLKRSSEIYNNKEEWLWGKEYHPHLFPNSDNGEPITYAKGVLGIDIYDTSSKAPVWHSRASKQMQESDFVPGNIDADWAIQRVLEKFPPR